MALAFEKIKKSFIVRSTGKETGGRAQVCLPNPGFGRTSKRLRGAVWPVEVLVGARSDWRASVLGHLWEDMVWASAPIFLSF